MLSRCGISAHEYCFVLITVSCDVQIRNPRSASAETVAPHPQAPTVERQKTLPVSSCSAVCVAPGAKTFGMPGTSWVLTECPGNNQRFGQDSASKLQFVMTAECYTGWNPQTLLGLQKHILSPTSALKAAAPLALEYLSPAFFSRVCAHACNSRGNRRNLAHEIAVFIHENALGYP